MAMKQRFMFWGVKIDVEVNDYADALSRFKPYPWQQLGFTVVDATDSVNRILNKLLKCDPNMDENYWKWLPHQREILRINITEQRIATNRTTKPRPKVFVKNRNILTKADFDNDP